jgi:hypothetical protein
MTEVAAERAVANTPEAEALIAAIYKAMSDYWDYLDRHGLIYDDKRDLMKASALHVTYDICGCDVALRDGPIGRRYNGGKDPDPEQRGLKPTWPHGALRPLT